MRPSPYLQPSLLHLSQVPELLPSCSSAIGWMQVILLEMPAPAPRICSLSLSCTQTHTVLEDPGLTAPRLSNLLEVGEVDWSALHQSLSPCSPSARAMLL